MVDDPYYSTETSAILLAMTALLRAEGVPASEALQRAHEVWKPRPRPSFHLSELRALVDELGGGQPTDMR